MRMDILRTRRRQERVLFRVPGNQRGLIMFRFIRNELRFRRCYHLGLLAAIITIVVIGRYMTPSSSGKTSECDCALRSERSDIREELTLRQRSGLGSPQSVPHRNSLLFRSELGKDAVHAGKREVLVDYPSVLPAPLKNVKEEANGARSKTGPTLPSNWSEKLNNIVRRFGDSLEQQRLLWSSLSTNVLLDVVLENKISHSMRAAMRILIGMEWLEDAAFFETHSDYFLNNQNSSDFVMPRLLMGDTNRCGSEDPFLLVLVPSVGNHSVVRKAMRHTWASPAYSHFLKWPMGVDFTEKVKLVFVVGRNESLHNDTNNNTDLNTTTTDNNTILMAEQKQYGDIVQYDFEDTYRNLTLKMMTAFHWMVNYCPKATFVLKADEDTFVNLPVLARLLHMVSRRSPRFVMGSSLRNATVLRRGRWRVNETDYPLLKYPDYMVGHSYVITGNVIPEILDTASQLPLVPIEDAFFTGLVAGLLRLPKMAVDTMATTQHSLRHCDIMRGKIVSHTHFKNKTLMTLWDQAQTGECGSLVLTDDEL